MSGHADTLRAGILAPDGDRDGEVVLDALRALGALEAGLVTQADRIAWLEGEVAGWRIKNQQLRDALTAMVEWFEKNDGRADDFGELWIVKDARAALDGTPSKLAECEERHG